MSYLTIAFIITASVVGTVLVLFFMGDMIFMYRENDEDEDDEGS